MFVRPNVRGAVDAIDREIAMLTKKADLARGQKWKWLVADAELSAMRLASLIVREHCPNWRG